MKSSKFSKSLYSIMLLVYIMIFHLQPYTTKVKAKVHTHATADLLVMYSTRWIACSGKITSPKCLLM